MYKLTLLALSALALTGAITVESPDRDTVWQSGTSSQTISWKSVSTDPDSFVVQLVNQAGYLTDSPVTLISNQSSGSSDITNTATVTYPNGNWPEGVAFQINFMSSDKNNAAILAQSNQFNITSGGSSSSSSSSSSASASASSTSSATGTSPTTISQSQTSSAVVVTSTDASSTGNIPNSSNSTTTGATSSASPVTSKGLFATLVGVVGLAAVFA